MVVLSHSLARTWLCTTYCSLLLVYWTKQPVFTCSRTYRNNTRTDRHLSNPTILLYSRVVCAHVNHRPSFVSVAIFRVQRGEKTPSFSRSTSPRDRTEQPFAAPPQANTKHNNSHLFDNVVFRVRNLLRQKCSKRALKTIGTHD